MVKLVAAQIFHLAKMRERCVHSANNTEKNFYYCDYFLLFAFSQQIPFYFFARIGISPELRFRLGKFDKKQIIIIITTPFAINVINIHHFSSTHTYKEIYSLVFKMKGKNSFFFTEHNAPQELLFVIKCVKTGQRVYISWWWLKKRNHQKREREETK